MSIVLYRDGFWISPYVFSCYVSLREKGLAFDVREVELQRGAQHDAEYVALSVTGRVPALVHDGFALTESMAILEYLDDVFPERPLLPKPLRDRARARQLMSWLRSDDTFAIREERSTHTMFYARATAPLSDKAKTARDKLVRIADRTLPAGKPQLFGDWGIADAELAFMMQRLLRSGDELPERLRSYAAATWDRPSIREFVELTRPPYVPY